MDQLLGAGRVGLQGVRALALSLEGELEGGRFRTILRLVSDDKTWLEVTELARERRDRLPVLQAACKVAEESEPYGARFAGRWVPQEPSR